MTRRDETEDLRADLRYLRDTLTDSITSGRTGRLSDILDTYLQLVDEFLSQLVELGEGYSKEDSFVELHSIGGGWQEVEWIAKDLRQAITDAAQSQNDAIMRAVIFMPIRIATLAFDKRDFYIFRRFVDLVGYAYWTVAKSPYDAIRKYGARACSEFLAQTTDYGVSRRIRDAATPKDARQAGQFGALLLAQFSSLLKHAYDMDRYEDFQKFAHDLSRVLGYRAPDDQGDVGALARELEQPHLNKVARKAKEYELEVTRAVEKAYAELDVMRHGITLGIGTWIIYEFVGNRISGVKAKQWMGALSFPNNVAQLVDIVFGDAGEALERELGWTWWELATKPSGTVHEIEFSDFMYLTFIIRMLELVDSFGVDRAPESLGRKIRYLAESEDSPLLRHLSALENDADRWVPVLGPEFRPRVDKVRSVLKSAVGKAKHEERRRIQRASIEDELVLEARDNVERAWVSHSQLRHLIQNAQSYQLIADEPEEIAPFGINTLELKENFLTRSDISVLDRGADYGEALADGENRRVLNALAEASTAPDPPISVAPHDVVERTRRAIKALHRDDLSPVIFTLNSWSASFELEQAGERVPSTAPPEEPLPKFYFEDVPGFSGTFDGDPCVLVTDIGRAGRWEQYPPPNLGPNEYLIRKTLAFAVTEFTPGLAEDLIRAWRARGEEHADGVEELLERVNVRLFERFVYRIDPSALIIRIPITD